MSKILIIEDEREIAELIRDYLEQEGYEVVISLDGEMGLRDYRRHKPDLVILDIMLPEVEGTEVCRIIRNDSNIPILMLSAKKSEVDKILSLGLGADDYVTKPFSPGELVARVKAQLRRYTLFSTPTAGKGVIKYGSLEINPKAYNVHMDGKKVDLSAKEFEILNLLATHPQQVFTREQIFDRIWGYHEFGDINTVTVHIRKIREKIEPVPARPHYIKTVWGVGYKFDGGSDDAGN
ncbi:MAG: response regulator transcription factor [Firmicutes bacterium]|nr:response regulator transcription factor [Bacillota bacterium]